jgi:hypothetical protein
MADRREAGAYLGGPDAGFELLEGSTSEVLLLKNDHAALSG